MSDDQRLAWLKTYGADEHFNAKTWNTFTVDSKNRRAVEMVRAMQLAKIPGAFIHGVAGCGKTHLMKCIFNHLVDWKLDLAAKGEHSVVKPYWIGISTYLDHLRNEKYDVKKKAQEASILFIDDLGTSTKTEWVTDQIFQLIDYRAERELQTFATSNYKLAELEPIYGTRIVSRLSSLMIVVEMTGDDRRKNQMKENFNNVILAMNRKPMSNEDNT